MANHDGELDIPRSYVRWTVDTRSRPGSMNRLRNSAFGFQSSQWQLSYYYYDHDARNIVHVLSLEKISGGRHAPFDVTVQVEAVGTKRIVKEDLSAEHHVYSYESDELRGEWIWSKTDVDIVRLNPKFGRDDHELRFLVELKEDDFLPGEECICTTCQFVQCGDNVPSLKSFSKDFGDLLDQNASEDVEFHCADAEDNILTTVKAHKLLVCARSPVLASMIHSEMVEGRTGVATVKDIDAGVFRQFLKYLYSGKLEETTVDAAMSLYEAGKRFQVKSLTEHCARRLVRTLTIEKSCQVLVLADAHGDEEFAEATVTFMANRGVPHAFDGWEDFCRSHPSLSIRVLNRFSKRFKEMSPEGCFKKRGASCN